MTYISVFIVISNIILFDTTIAAILYIAAVEDHPSLIAGSKVLRSTKYN